VTRGWFRKGEEICGGDREEGAIKSVGNCHTDRSQLKIVAMAWCIVTVA